MMRDLKGPDIFIDAIARAEKAGSAASLRAVMVGEGDDLPSYRAQVEAARPGRPHPLPATDAGPRSLCAGHLVVVPSRAEAMPYIVLETLAAGKPMIATAVGGIPEIFGSSSPALVGPDPDELGNKMVEALADPGAYRSAMPDGQRPQGALRRRRHGREIEKAYFAALRR